ncbi:host attachment family protein [Tropicimonas isoalkanivorans]|uniref:Protein required for attachment to host cells n=1 Tax=Tropicimonas isoalkanivorans TaxID=441112 RepID=A0A1I1G611_9RHOB|nr:host attachment family protein [Tropicimonas isoalkanivorans]SFC05268.1 Protein required for attachment to host cells [Tropicimonas isoalkanivorans]
MKRLTAGTWVLVADGEKALFLRNDLDAQDPDLNVQEEKSQDNPPTREQAANRPGRKADTGVQQRSAMDDTDWHELAKERFADELADMLFKRVHSGKIERLVIVAPPKVLGELRNKMHKEVEDVVVAEIPKTLTNHPIDKIERLVKEELESA